MAHSPSHDSIVLQIGNKLISADLGEELFACDLSACKGACCVEGDLGAPLEKAELSVMKEILPKVKPFLREEGRKALDKQGAYVKDFTGGYSTPLVKGKECAYVTFDEKGVALCGIEQAHAAGAVDFQKPISCHLYPIRVLKLTEFEALNYHRWSICSPACKRGRQEGIKVYEFLKGPLIRAYGEDFYEELEAIFKGMAQQTGAEEEAES